MVQKKAISLIVLFVGILLLTDTTAVETPEDPKAFVTWNIFEADKCASIWLIKRFIAPSAVIRFFNREETSPPGIPFDIPEARFRRYHNRSTFETLLEHYQVEDKALIYIGRIIHDIEVNIWERKALEETHRIESNVIELLNGETPEKSAVACVNYFDALYSTLQ